MKIFLGLAVVAGAALSAVQVGCASSDDADGKPDAAIDADTAEASLPGPDADSDAQQGAPVGCAAYARAYCGRLEACASGYFFPSRFADRAACESTYTKTCDLQRAAPGIKVSPANLGACVASAASLSCDDLFSRKTPDSCGPLGTLDLGKPCGNDLQCSSGFCATSSNCGVCAKAPTLGERCISGKCGAGFTCTGGFGDDKTCVAVVGMGAVCNETAYCRFGLSCIQGKCGAPLAEGAACSAGGVPGDPECDAAQGLQCNGFGPGSVCVKPAYANVGAACGFGEKDTDAGLRFHPTRCRADGACPNVPGDATCTPRGAEGAACDASNPDACRYELACRGGTCAFDDASTCK